MTSDKSYGEVLVGIDFNPSNDDVVHLIKSRYAEIINMLQAAKLDEANHPERQRYLSIAITEAQTAQMWAVKGVTAK